jgi:hypothetical protein
MVETRARVFRVGVCWRPRLVESPGSIIRRIPRPLSGGAQTWAI